MHRRGAEDLGIGPRCRSVESPIDLEDARSVTEAPERSAIAGGKAAVVDLQHLPGSEIEERRARRRKLSQRADAVVALDRAAARLDDRAEGSGDRRRPAFDHRPSHVMGQRTQKQSEAGRDG